VVWHGPVRRRRRRFAGERSLTLRPPPTHPPDGLLTQALEAAWAVAQVGELAQRVQEVTAQSVELAFVDQAYTGDAAAQAAASQGIQLAVVKLPQAKHGFVLLPRRWVVERTFAWLHNFRRLRTRYEREPENHQAFLHLGCAVICQRMLGWP